jgi:NAD(P)-dependent dehydrogenase (short-subunit alcohol dehydrogenase family)
MNGDGSTRSFAGMLAVVTGGGTGMGRELVVQLAAEGCSVATCDINDDALAATAGRALDGAPEGVRVSTHHCDVSDPAQVARFREEVVTRHRTGHINLLFNNAGIAGGGSFVAGSPREWERTFGVCWGGVYHCSRAFVPLLVASEEGYLVNTSSVNGFWATLGPGIPHTAYSTAKFAVKGFSEALLEDFRVHAPHVRVSVVMPGHVGTDIVINSRRAHGGSEPEEMTPEEIEEARAAMVARGMPRDRLSDDVVRGNVREWGEGFRDRAPLSAADAATIILGGVRAGRWRILVGDDAHALDTAARADPLALYSPGGAVTLADALDGPSPVR